MDRNTRKANLKKLQLASSLELRTTRSRTKGKDTITSNFFNPPEIRNGGTVNHSENTRPDEPQKKKSKESEDQQGDSHSNEEKTILGRAGCNEPAVKTKKTPKAKSRVSRRGRNRQQPSISNFLRNEQLFAEVTAQHCMVDNFSPDDIELALALSKSEAEKFGRLRLNDTDEDTVDLQKDDGTENIRSKLQKYGFRTAPKEDYSTITSAFWSKAKRGKRAKWANKFTSLTLRNPETQQKKLEANVEKLLAMQGITKEPSGEDLFLAPYKLLSKRLQALEATAEYRCINEPSDSPIDDLSAYYVTSLFEVSNMPADHMLKSWTAIQGRDLSPQRQTDKNRRHMQEFERVYVEMEMYFCRDTITGSERSLEMTSEKELPQQNELNDLTELQEQSEQTTVFNKTNPCVSLPEPSSFSPLKEPPDKRAKMTETETTEITVSPNFKSMINLETQEERCISPDIFADSDEEEMVVVGSKITRPHDPSLTTNEDLNTSDVKEISSNITTYEVYSSDEVKTYMNATPRKKLSTEKFDESFIDLTKDDTFPCKKRANSCSSDQNILDLKPICSDLPALSQNADFEILSLTSASSLSEDIPQFNRKLDSSLFDTDKEEEYLNLIITSPIKLSLSSSKASPINTPSTWKMFNESTTQADTPTTRTSIRKSISFSLTQCSKEIENCHFQEEITSPLACRQSSCFIEKLASLYESQASIDLTEDSSDEGNNDPEGILLSDDEINYSIWKANKSVKVQNKSNELPSCNSSVSFDELTNEKPSPDFKKNEIEALFDNSQACLNKSWNLCSPNKSELSKQRAEFGILDAALSQSFTFSELQTPTKTEESPAKIDWENASFLETAAVSSVKRFSSSSNHKFTELIAKVSKPATSDDDFDEFDRLVFQMDSNCSSKSSTSVLSGMDRLLEGEINLETLPHLGITPASQTPAPSKLSTPSKNSAEPFQEVKVNGNIYFVRPSCTPKPDFTQMPESELLKQLYNFGMKPLKRKHAVKMLEFIYNQTHPIVLPEKLPRTISPPCLPRSKSTPIISANNKPHGRLQKTDSLDCLTPTETRSEGKWKFRDAFGDMLLRFSESQSLSLCGDFECYVLQTNVTKKTARPLLPLHTAWHNLLCANPELHDSVLMYEPIDLQEIYMYFKELGHRYDPKDLKAFFDRRCITFRYELTAPAKQVQRHVRKNTKKSSSKC